MAGSGGSASSCHVTKKVFDRVILYEYPCNERVRALLRVEHLFDRLFFFADSGEVRHHQIAIATLFDLLDICDRTDLRGAVLQDLERLRSSLLALRQHPGVDEQRLAGMLDELQAAAAELGSSGRIAQELRENEWLSGLRGRLTVPGGSSQVDSPSYYSWQIQPVEVRAKDIAQWVRPFLPLYKGIALILRSLRDSGDAVDLVASQGAYQEMLSGKTFQLLRVWVSPESGVFPEMSANKYVIWIRFSGQEGTSKPQPVSSDIPFRLARCNI
ncbi:cell division protein ZapD [Paracandidimonas soli]|uniref:cell division protein ZapD n=1 Tax=Paracandidimonas soli TaxID=1917182 RepID=UPI001048C3A5